MDNPRESMTLVMYGDMPLYLKTMVGSCSCVTNELHQLKFPTIQVTTFHCFNNWK